METTPNSFQKMFVSNTFMKMKPTTTNRQNINRRAIDKVNIDIPKNNKRLNTPLIPSHLPHIFKTDHTFIIVFF